MLRFVMMLVLVLGSTVFAQDLDAPKTGVAVAAPIPTASVLDQFLSRLQSAFDRLQVTRGLAAEFAYLRESDIAWIAIELGYVWDWASGDPDFLTPAELTAFREAQQTTWRRLVAAGLN